MNKHILFESFHLKGLELKNRVVMAPMTRSRSNNPGSVATELTALYYRQRASAGLIISEGTYVSRDAVGYINVPGIYTDEQVRGWKLVTDAVHQEGGKIFAQLWHVGRISHPDLLNGQLPLAPSALNPFEKVYTPGGFKETVEARAMTLDEIKKTIADFKSAARNALKAGFDGVELHASNGYLLHQFFNLYSNKRQDQYGGSVENRARILFDILDELRSIIDMGEVGVRLNPSLNGYLGMMVDEETIAVFDYIVTKLNEYDLAYLHLSEPFTDVSGNEKAIQEVAKHYRPIYKGVLMINRGFNKDTAKKVLSEGHADLVSFGVPYIANPDLVERFKADAALSTPDQATFYTPGEKGYIDYPFMNNN